LRALSFPGDLFSVHHTAFDESGLEALNLDHAGALANVGAYGGALVGGRTPPIPATQDRIFL
jgi:hypothetical protein